jgi:hypothetical protein
LDNSKFYNTARRLIGGAGTQTAALAFGGYSPGGNLQQQKNMMETAWTTVNSMNAARAYIGSLALKQLL